MYFFGTSCLLIEAESFHPELSDKGVESSSHPFQKEYVKP